MTLNSRAQRVLHHICTNRYVNSSPILCGTEQVGLCCTEVKLNSKFSLNESSMMHVISVLLGELQSHILLIGL
jgi:hypothetical protein